MPLTDAGHITEFYAGFNGTCGECALEVAYAAADGKKANLDDMVAITHEMQNHGQAGANGASTLWDLAREAERRGLKILIEWDYAEPFPHDWHQVLLDNKGKYPIVLQLANGQALHDIETGAADEKGLQYHFIVVLGAQADGYIVNDGDNYQVSNRFQVYDYQTLINAKVCGLLMVTHPDAPPPPPPTGGSNVAIPSGWKDDGTTLVAPNGKKVVQGFREYVLTHNWNANNYPVEDEHGQDPMEYGNPSINAGSQQAFRWTVLEWNQASGVFEMWTGQEIVAIRDRLVKAEAQVKSLEDQVHQLQNQPPVTVPAPIPPEVKNALAAAKNLLAPFTALSGEVDDALGKI